MRRLADALSGSLLLDAAMGTALIARGLRGRAPEWNLSHPDAVLDVHRSHVEAGAEVVLTNTFAGANPNEAEAGLRLARKSGAEFVAGSLWAGLLDLDRQIAQLRARDVRAVTSGKLRSLNPMTLADACFIIDSTICFSLGETMAIVISPRAARSSATRAKFSVAHCLVSKAAAG